MAAPTLVADPGLTVESPELTLNVDALRELEGAIRADADDFERAVRDELGIEGSILEMSVTLELPTNLAGPVGKALRSIDVAWRLAFVLAELDRLDLSSGEEVSLDQLAPVESAGLRIVGADSGSFRSKLQAAEPTLARIYRFLKGVSVAAGIAANVHGFVASPPAHAGVPPPQPPKCELTISGHLQEPLGQVIRREVPAPPQKCEIKVHVTTPEGARIDGDLPSAA